MKLAYADPPYPGQSKKHYGDHEDYAGEVDHLALAEQLREYDGWVLHTSAPAAFSVQQALAAVGEVPMADDFSPGTYRAMAWVKPFAAFKRNVSVAYAWEPVFIKAARKPVVTAGNVSRDFIAESITMKRGLTGAKPDAVCRWAFRCMGADRGDELHDLFPGSGAVGRAWESWAAQDELVLVQSAPAVSGTPDTPSCDHDWVYASEGDYGECRLCDASVNVIAGTPDTAA